MLKNNEDLIEKKFWQAYDDQSKKDMEEEMIVNLHLIRHGQTNRNAIPDLIGQSPDEPLSDIGKSKPKLSAIDY